MRKIFVVGSINMDLVARLVSLPQKGETVLAESFFCNPGGKGANQAVAIAKLGGNVKMIGKVGTDGYGQRMVQNLANFGVDTACVGQVEGESGMAFIGIVGCDNSIIVLSNANDTLGKDDIDQGLWGAQPGDILVTQLETPLAMVEYALQVAKQKGMQTILNPAPAQKNLGSVLPLVDILVPNETETEILTGIYPVDEVHTVLAIKKLYQYGVGKVIITLGANGSVCSEGQTLTYIDGIKTNAVDTTSAGDTYIGAVATKLAEGMPILDACNYATVAASITVTRKGASGSIPTKQEVEQKIKERQSNNKEL